MTYFQATSDSLPSVYLEMVLSFLQTNKNFNSVEYRGAKATRSGKPEYGDKAIGWVDLKREGTLCHVRGRITPEHKIRSEPYRVAAVIDEDNDEVLSAECQDCAASQGGCKHCIAFLFWLHRRSEEPSPTETVSYWKRSTMSLIGTRRHSTLKEFLGEGRAITLPAPKCDLLQEARNFFPSTSKNFLALNWSEGNKLSINTLIVDYKESAADPSGMGFLKFCSQQMHQDLCNEVEEATRNQADSTLWHEMRFGRVTASNLWACSRYQHGTSLPNTLLGSGKPIQTPAMARGRELEPIVVESVGKTLGIPLKKSGIMLSKDFPFLGASPDAVADGFVLEVKCPSKKDTLKNYIKDGELTPNCNAQIQLQMMLARKSEGLFVVAEPRDDGNLELDFNWVAYDPSGVSALIESARNFWTSHIYPHLISMY